MLTYTKFAGINNVLPPARLSNKELAVALDVDIDASGGIRRRQGYTETVAECHKNLWQAQGFVLATRNGDLIARFPNGTVVLLYPAIGTARVWYCNLPDGRTTFTNDSITGVTNGLTATTWGVPLPPSIGALTDVAGQLFPGDYQYALTYVRLSDGLEGGPTYSNPLPVAAGGVVLTGLPTLAGHSINVYLSGHNGGAEFLAGNTTNSAFSYTGKNSALILPCRTNYMTPAPAGTVTAFWRGRVLIADGKVLWASRPNQWELFDQRSDFKQFSSNITLIVPVTNGVYVGTTTELLFLAGTEFDKLVSSQVVSGAVVLGSGVPVRGEQIRKGDGVGEGKAMICIADRTIVAGFDNGDVVRMTESRYAVAPDVAEVSATFRMSNGTPQYLAVPQ
jgi:hypothetical protein